MATPHPFKEVGAEEATEAEEEEEWRWPSLPLEEEGVWPPPRLSKKKKKKHKNNNKKKKKVGGGHHSKDINI